MVLAFPMAIITDEQERTWTVIGVSTYKPRTHTQLRFELR